MNTDNFDEDTMQGPKLHQEPTDLYGDNEVVVEAIDGDMATVTRGDQTLQVPLEALPKGVQQGDRIDSKTGEIMQDDHDMDDMGMDGMGDDPRAG